MFNIRCIILFMLLQVISNNCFIVNLTPQNIGNKPPLCINCENCIYEESKHTFLCAWFAQLNIVNGQTHYIACSIARNDDSKCGVDGKLFFHSLNQSSSSSST